MSEREPVIWSHITDGLPEDHPLAYETLYCVTCREMLHAGNNECMQTWVETGKGPYCIEDFVEAIKDVQPAGETVIRGHTLSYAETVYYLMDEGEGWGL